MPNCSKHGWFTDFEGSQGGIEFKCPKCRRESNVQEMKNIIKIIKIVIAIILFLLALIYGLFYKLPKYIARKSNPENKTRNVLIYFTVLAALIAGGVIYVSYAIEETAAAEAAATAAIEEQKKQNAGELVYGGKKYKTIKIGTQIWMAENLNYDAKGSVCYDDDPANCEIYGRLYNWAKAMTVCPDGWHLPSDAEWTALTDYAGGAKTAGTKLKATSGWNSYSYSGVPAGTDVYGFAALPGGLGSSDGFFDAGLDGNWWSGSEFEADFAYGWYMDYKVVGRNNYYKPHLLSVRCVQAPTRDPELEPEATQIQAQTQEKQETENKAAIEAQQNVGELVYGGKKYKTIKIGTQIWMAENLNHNAGGGKCYGDKSANCDKYGRLYSWNTAKKICPDGWHLPSDAEWTALTDYAGGATTAGTKLKATSGWNSYSGVPAGTDVYEFAALPGGLGGSDGSFSNVSSGGIWWSSTEHDASNAWYRIMGYNFEDVNRYSYSKASLFSVRCVKDE